MGVVEYGCVVDYCFTLVILNLFFVIFFLCLLLVDRLLLGAGGFFFLSLYSLTNPKLLLKT